MTNSTFSVVRLLVRRSLAQHAVATGITILSVALASGLLLSVFAIQSQAYSAFTGGPIGFDAILGARGSQLQLVLNCIFHLETSPGNLPWKLFRSIKDDPRVSLAIPYAVGDNYFGFRIVGTTDELFTRFEYQAGSKFRTREGGHFFDSSRKEAVIGSFVAQQTGLREGSKFSPYHGVIFDEKMLHEEQYVVTGVLEPTNSPADRVIWIPIEGIFRMGGHVLRGSGDEFKAEAGVEIPDEHKEVSAVMLKLKSPQSGFSLDRLINRQGKEATLAWPIGRVMAELFQKIGWVNRVLELVAYLVVVVAAASILASVYNTLRERRREFAILRALGARRRVIFSVIVFEATAIAAAGSLLGVIVYAGILSIASSIVRAETGVVLNVFQYHPVLLFGPLGMTALGALAGLLPAWSAYRTDVSENLVPHS
ncbi:MAG: ABC transporter permease [Candidatus Hydrogenedentota bacterium]